MDEEVAWKYFLKTGSVESFLAYKKMLDDKDELGTIEEQGLQNIPLENEDKQDN